MSDIGVLYLVGTPIGNLKDITIRALEILKTVDYIACEDTRHSLRLLNNYDIKKPLISYYKEKEQQGSELIIQKLKEGFNIALITDAGMPCISDPGSILVKKARENNCRIEIIPGPSAVVSAYALSGSLTYGFVFIGFLPNKQSERKEVLLSYKNSSHTIILYCPPHDVKKKLKEILNVLGDRDVSLVKEMTKIHENVLQGKISDLLKIDEFKGEYVVLIEPSSDDNTDTITNPKDLLKSCLDMGMSKKEAIKYVSKELNMVKDDVYKIFLLEF